MREFVPVYSLVVQQCMNKVRVVKYCHRSHHPHSRLQLHRQPFPHFGPLSLAWSTLSVHNQKRRGGGRGGAGRGVVVAGPAAASTMVRVGRRERSILTWSVLRRRGIARWGRRGRQRMRAFDHNACLLEECCCSVGFQWQCV